MIPWTWDSPFRMAIATGYGQLISTPAQGPTVHGIEPVYHSPPDTARKGSRDAEEADSERP